MIMSEKMKQSIEELKKLYADIYADAGKPDLKLWRIIEIFEQFDQRISDIERPLKCLVSAYPTSGDHQLSQQERERLINKIRIFYPPDHHPEGRELLMRAVCKHWDILPDAILLELLNLCLEKERS